MSLPDEKRISILINKEDEKDIKALVKEMRHARRSGVIDKENTFWVHAAHFCHGVKVTEDFFKRNMPAREAVMKKVFQNDR